MQIIEQMFSIYKFFGNKALFAIENPSLHANGMRDKRSYRGTTAFDKLIVS